MPKLQVYSIVEGATCLYGDFSPRATPLRSEDIIKVMAPILQIMPKPHELFGKPSVVISTAVGSVVAMHGAISIVTRIACLNGLWRIYGVFE
jgi:hypothetical protein